jgi:Na+-driven multidrug efflux pump
VATNSNSNNDNDQPKENPFQIMDGIIQQLNRTKKMFIIMILTIMIIPPIAFAVTFALLGPPFPFHDAGGPHDRFGPGFNPAFGIARVIPFLISLIWLGIGIRQWFVLSKWTKKYERYKELQKKIDEKLDYDNADDEVDKKENNNNDRGL